MVSLVTSLADVVREGRCLIIFPFLFFYLRLGSDPRQSLVCSVLLELPCQDGDHQTIWEQEEESKLPFHRQLRSRSMLFCILNSFDCFDSNKTMESRARRKTVKVKFSFHRVLGALL